MKISFLSNNIPWFGKYSGYECLVNYLPKHVQFKTITPEYNLKSRVLGKLASIQHQLKDVNSYYIHSETLFLRSLNENTKGHILYLEQHIKTISSLTKQEQKINATIHLPFSQWKNDSLRYLDKIGQLFFLYEQEINEFAQYVDKDKIKFISHGVDNTFFQPVIDLQSINKKQILFVGHFLRDFELFEKTYHLIEKEISNDFLFHFIIPEQHRNNKNLINLSTNKNIFFHQNLSDDELLKFYQHSYLMLMPMIDSGANTAIVQAIACGLPVVTNDIGGIRSYGGNSLYPISKPKDASGLADIFYKYVSDTDYRNNMSISMRKFSLENLDWHKITQKHLDSYI